MHLRKPQLTSLAPENVELPTATLWQILEDTVHEHAHRTALVHGNHEVSYATLAQRVQNIENALRHTQPVVGERIAIVASKTPEVVVALLAALHLRVVLVIVNPALKSRQIHHILHDSGATTLMCESRKWEQLTSDGVTSCHLKRLVTLPSALRTDSSSCTGSRSAEDSHNEEFAGDVTVVPWDQFANSQGSGESAAVDHPDADDAALILYTSGSTGKPKGVVLTHANLFYGARSVSTYLENSHKDRILALMPFSFDYGLSQLTTSLCCGATLVLYDYVVPRGVRDIVIQHEITGIPAVPHVWDQLAKIDWPDLPYLRYITSTGGRLQPPTIKLLSEKLPSTQVYSMYGFTEAFRATYLTPSEVSLRPDSIGKAVPFAEVLVVDEVGRELAPGEHGELIQAGPLVSLGYWNDPDATADKIRQRKNMTTSGKRYAWSGDLAYKDNDGYLYFVSRKDDQVKLNGYRTSPSEVEAALTACPWINEACVLCIPDSRFGFVAVAFVVLDVPISTAELSHWCRNALPSFMVPSKWIILEKLPDTPNNKIDRQGLLATITNATS